MAAHAPDGAERPRDQGQSPKWLQKRRARSTVSLFMVNLGFAHLSGHDGNHIHAFWHGQFTAHRLAGLGAQARASHSCQPWQGQSVVAKLLRVCWLLTC